MKASSDVTLRCMAVLMVCFAANGASAQEVYGGVGLFGTQIGYAHALSPSWTVRGDYMTMGQRSKTTTESDTEYQAHLKMNRTALLADWFPWESSTFRLTGGATFNQVQFDLTAGGAGTSVDINNQKYILGAGDALKSRSRCRAPRLTWGWVGGTSRAVRAGAFMPIWVFLWASSSSPKPVRVGCARGAHWA